MNKVKPRITYIFLLFFLIFSFSSNTHAQILDLKKRNFHIVILETLSRASIQLRSKLLIDQLNQMAEQYNIHFTFSVGSADTSYEKGKVFLKDQIQKKKPDMVVTIATLATEVGMDVLEGTDIPQVFLLVADPVKLGITKAIYQSSDRNITGRSPHIPQKLKLDLLKKIYEASHQTEPLHVALFYTNYSVSIYDANELMAVSKEHSFIRFYPLMIPYRKVGEALSQLEYVIDKRLKELPTNVEYFWIATGPNAWDQQLIERIKERKNLTYLFSYNKEAMKKGALISMNTNVTSEINDISETILMVLKGQDISKIPIMFYQDFDISFNLSVAEKMGIIIPSDLIELAKDNLYWKTENASSK